MDENIIASMRKKIIEAMKNLLIDPMDENPIAPMRKNIIEAMKNLLIDPMHQTFIES